MKRYENQIVRMSARKACEKFVHMWKTAGEQAVYVDFYYFRLPSEAQERVNSVLTLQEQTYIEQLPHEDGQVLFPADERLLSVCTKLNEREMLFSTIYVTGECRSTWWGNYGQEYIVFTEKAFPLPGHPSEENYDAGEHAGNEKGREVQ